MEKSVDRGWSFVVLVGVYINAILTFGFLQCIGIFFIEWEEDLGVSAQTVGWSSSVAVAGFGIAGLISSIISDYVSCRWQGFFGGMVASTALSCSGWIVEVTHLYLVMAFTGFGIGLAFTNSVVILGYYFDKRIALANGLGLSGIGAGMFILAPLARYLNDEYSWRGAMTIFGALLANICACAALFRKSIAEAISMAGVEPTTRTVLKSIPSRSECANGVQDETIEMTNTRTDGYEKISELPARPSKVSLCVDEEKEGVEEREKNKMRADGYESVGNLPSRNSKVRLAEMDTASVDRVQRKSRSSVAGSVRKHSTALVKSYTVVLSVRYVMMGVVSPFLIGVAYYAATLYFASNAINLGVSKTEAAFLISIIGITGIVGRLCCGPILDTKFVTPFQFVMLLSAVVGGLCLLGTLAKTYPWLVVFATTFGLTSSTCNVTYPLIIRTVVGSNSYKKVFGISVIVWNTSALIGLPVIGYIYDTTGDYAVAFYIAGCLFLLNSVVIILDPLWIKVDIKCKSLGARLSENNSAFEVQ